MNALLLGANSTIGLELAKRLRADGWQVWGWRRGGPLSMLPEWDLAIVAMGQVAPVGHWADQDPDEWESAVQSNVLLPVRMLRELWSRRLTPAAVCFMAGSNPNKVLENYTAYSVGKMALLKACEHMDAESPDTKFFALAPGFVNTKIHTASLEAGVKNERLERGLREGDGTPYDDIYGCLKWCLEQPKEIIGGRNICVSDPWRAKSAWNGGERLSHKLKNNPSWGKLRRNESL